MIFRFASSWTSVSTDFFFAARFPAAFLGRSCGRSFSWQAWAVVQNGWCGRD
jgi:hypothetical protein